MNYEPMTVVGLKVDAFQRIEAAQLQLSPTGLIPVRGKNEAGKSSLLEAMISPMLGKKGKSELPITEGHDRGSVEVDLGEIKVVESFSRDSAGKAKSKLTITAKDGTTIKSPRAVMEALVGEFVDPAAFLKLSGPEQVKTVLRVMGVEEELARLEEIAQGHFENRRDFGREKKNTQATFDALALEVQGLPAPPTEGTIPELTAKLQAANDHNNARMSLGATLENKATEGHRLAEEIKQLEQDLKAKKEQKDALAAEWTEVSAKLKAMDPEIDTTPIADALAEHEAASEHEGRRQLYEHTKGNLENITTKHNEAEACLKSTRDEITSLISGTEFPDPTMAYDAESKSITINGIPFSKASQGQKLKAAASIAMAGNPKIKVIFVRDASLLDEEAQQLLGNLAEEKGFQLWCELVDSKREGVGIYIEEGQVVEPPQNV